jgi:PTS system beta-glucosides-specific IIC component
MAKQEKYAILADQVLELVGGKDNIEFFTHCVTRLRFVLKDQSLAKTDEIGKVNGVLGVQWQSGQLQIIIGQSVGDAYKLICEKGGLNAEAPVDASDDEKKEKKKLTAGGVLNSVFDAISGCLTPTIPVLIGCGMIKVLLIILESAGLLTSDNVTYQLISAVGDAGFYFLPILVGGNAAKKFGANQALGMVIGGMLIYPTFVDGVSAGTAFNLFGLPVYGASYTSTIFPVILCVWVMAPIEKFFAKISPDSLRSIIEPLCTLIIMLPLSFCLLAPAGAFLGNYVSAFVIWLYNTIGFVGVAVLAAFMPFLIMTGMHSAFVPYLLQMFGSVGYEPIFFTALVISNIDQGASALAVALKTKDKNVRSTSLSCAVTAIVAGVTEPAMYGVNLKYKKPMWGAMIGSAIAGLFAGLAKVYIYAFAGASSIVAIPCFIGPDSSNVIEMCIAIVIGIVATFVATFILYKDEEAAA